MSYNVCKLYLKVDIKRKLNMYKIYFLLGYISTPSP